MLRCKRLNLNLLAAKFRRVPETREITPYLWVHPDEETVSCLWHALDENEREHPKTGKRDRDEETIGNEFFKCPHDPNPVV